MEKLFAVASKAVSDNRADRQQSIMQLREEWNEDYDEKIFGGEK